MVKRAANLDSGRAQLRFAGINLHFGKLARIPGGWRIAMRVTLPQDSFGKGKHAHWLAFAGLPLFKYFKNHFFNGAEMAFSTRGGKRLLLISAHTPFMQTPVGNWACYRCAISVAGGRPATVQAVFFTRTARLKIPFAFHHLPIPR